MSEIKLGEKLQILRKEMQYSQKDFADFLEIPQPSLSAYENNRNSPTMDVLINIATKCSVSLDWLCGLSSTSYTVSTLGEASELLYKLFETNEFGIEIEVHDHLPGDIETESEKWYTRLTVYGNDRKYKYNAELCQIIKRIRENLLDLESYSISPDVYEMTKEKSKSYYDLPITQRKHPELNREERFKKHIEYMKEHENL